MIDELFRAECLNAHWFMSLADARQKMEAWRRYYNLGAGVPRQDLLERLRRFRKGFGSSSD